MEVLTLLYLTDNAASAVERLLTQRPEAGLRISPDRSNGSDGNRLGLTVADNPSPGDEVIEQPGWRVFLDQDVVEVLDGTLLDARVDENSYMEFSVVRPS